jgi:hypothetical protein
MSNPPTDSSTRQVKLRVKYDELAATFASQVLLNTTAEEVFLDFSSGILNDPGSGESVLQVHTRIAMTHAGAKRLLGALQQVLSKAAAGPESSETPRATLPKLGSTP